MNLSINRKWGLNPGLSAAEQTEQCMKTPRQPLMKEDAQSSVCLFEGMLVRRLVLKSKQGLGV